MTAAHSNPGHVSGDFLEAAHAMQVRSIFVAEFAISHFNAAPDVTEVGI
jgi:hypothetical protein